MSSSEMDVNRGRRIAGIRKNKGMSQDELADEAGLSRASLSKIENGGDFLVSTFLNLVSTLDTTPNRILYEESDEKEALIDDINAELNEMDELELKRLLGALRGYRAVC